MFNRVATAAALAAGIAVSFTSASIAAEVRSIGRITSGPDSVLFVADWKAGRLIALDLPRPEAGPDAPFNVLDLSGALRSALGTTDVKVDGLAKRPDSSEVYLAVSAGPEERPAILAVTPDGRAHALDIAALHATSVGIEDAPTGDFKFWGRTPARSYTVTDMKWHEGRLYLAGLANQSFSSSLRIIPFPFKGRQSVSYVEMYHTSHNQMETRAPVREMTFENLDGRDTLVATYLCTPVVTIPVSELHDGAHVVGRTIAELGYGNYPNGMVSFAAGEPGHAARYVLVTNAYRSATLIPVDEIAKAAAQPGLAKPVPFGED